MKRIKLLYMVLIAAALVLILSSCDIGKIIKHFEDWIKTTEDGFTYYYNENNDKGVFILDIPDTEELTIPEYIDGKKVVELGHLHSGLGYENRYVVHGENTKKLTVQHQFIAEHDCDKLVDFTNIKTLTFMDFLYCNQTYLEDELMVSEKTDPVFLSNSIFQRLSKQCRFITTNYLNSRYYNPEVGRFVNADEVTNLGVGRSIQCLNLCYYAENNPVCMMDKDVIFGNQSIYLSNGRLEINCYC